MSSNVYTKDEILRELATKGLFVDSFTLDSFFKVWKIDALYEDDNGNEFFDKNTMNIVLEKLFNKDIQPLDDDAPEFSIKKPAEELPIESTPEAEVEEKKEDPETPKINREPEFKEENPVPLDEKQIPESVSTSSIQDFKISDIQDTLIIDDPDAPEVTTIPSEVSNARRNSTLELLQQYTSETEAPSNEVNMLQNVQNEINVQEKIAAEVSAPVKQGLAQEPTGKIPDVLMNDDDIFTPKPSVAQTSPVAQQPAPAQKQEAAPTLDDIDKAPVEDPQEAIRKALQNGIIDGLEDQHDDSEIDDLTLLSESFEAQEKLRDYVVNELGKKNFDMSVPQNVPKIDIPEEILNTIAKAMAKKITRQVSEFCANETMYTAKISELKEKVANMEIKNRELEKQNKKLRLLLVESNKNLNSYKPSIFGLYKKSKIKK